MLKIMPAETILYRASFGLRLLDYYQLTKPRLILLFLITTAASMWVASHGRVNLWTFCITLLSGACAAGSVRPRY
jgi:heme o synthase